MTCKTWSQKDSTHWRGLCANTFYPDNAVESQACSVCVNPNEVPGACSGCEVSPAKAYVVSLFQVSGATAAGCCSDYIRDFVVYQSGACTWVSKEIERAARSSLDNSLPITCYDENCQRPRVVLINSVVFSPARTQWLIQVNWRTASMPGFPGYFTKNTAQSRGRASKIDCMQPVNTIPIAGFKDTFFGFDNYWATPCGTNTSVRTWSLHGFVRPLG